MKAKLVVVLVFAAVFFFAREAQADDVAPALEGADLRARADLMLRALVAKKPDPKLRGLYAAFDPSVADPRVMSACDDDGDYVIVISDAMLRLAAFVARAAKDDEDNGTRKVDDYADFLVQNQAIGRRLLPPAAGAFAAMDGAAPVGSEPVSASVEQRWNEMLLFLYARELAHLRAGDLVCSSPTSTKERGDDEWTAAEQAAAMKTASTLYPGKQLERDGSAIAEIHALGQETSSALVLVQFFARFEATNAVTPARMVPTYLAMHPRSAWRAAGMKAAASAHPRPSANVIP